MGLRPAKVHEIRWRRRFAFACQLLIRAERFAGGVLSGSACPTNLVFRPRPWVCPTGYARALVVSPKRLGVTPHNLSFRNSDKHGTLWIELSSQCSGRKPTFLLAPAIPTTM